MEALVPVRCCCNAQIKGFIQTSDLAITSYAPPWNADIPGLKLRPFEGEDDYGLDAEGISDEELEKIPGYISMDNFMSKGTKTWKRTWRKGK